MKYIDLSVALNEGMPVYPGDPKFKLEQSGILEKDGYADSFFYAGTHNGTHIDAPCHMIKGGKTLDQIPVDTFVGNGVYINVGSEFDIDELRRVKITRGDIVIFYTGMSDFYFKSAYFENYPGMPEEIAKFLVSKKVKMVGVDMCSIDHEPFDSHKILLKKDILIIENLTNLTTLKKKKFKIYALPIKLQTDGAPARVIAEIF